MDTRTKYALGFVLIAVIFISAFVVAPSAEFSGADDQGGQKIAEIDPDYEPWAENLWEPPAETASLLFALQAAIGAIVIGYFIGNEHGKKSALKSAGIVSAPQTKNGPQEKTEKKTGNA